MAKIEIKTLEIVRRIRDEHYEKTKGYVDGRASAILSPRSRRGKCGGSAMGTLE